MCACVRGVADTGITKGSIKPLCRLPQPRLHGWRVVVKTTCFTNLYQYMEPLSSRCVTILVCLQARWAAPSGTSSRDTATYVAWDCVSRVGVNRLLSETD